jgi:hypothetical protein
LPTENDYQRTIVEAATIGGWRVIHFRPGRTKWGWATPLQGHPGYPDLTLARDRLIIAELKIRGRKLTTDQTIWIETLRTAGIDARVIQLPDHLDAFCTELITPAERHVRALSIDRREAR